MNNGRIKLTSGFPSAAKAAKTLGVSKKVAEDLHALAEHSLKTGEFVLPGVGRLMRGGRITKLPARKRVSDARKHAIATTKKS